MQRLRRLEKKGVSTDAMRDFQNAISVSRETLKGRKKDAAIERAAKQFLKSGMSTVTEIKAKVEKAKQKSKYEREYLEEREKGGATIQELADYLDAMKREKDVIIAKHFAGSDAIQQIADAQKANKFSSSDFYDMIHKLALKTSKREYSPDEISALIVEMEEKLKKERR